MAVINRYFFVPIDNKSQSAKHNSSTSNLGAVGKNGFLFYFIVFGHYFVFEQSHNGRKAMSLLTAGIEY